MLFGTFLAVSVIRAILDVLRVKKKKNLKNTITRSI